MKVIAGIIIQDKKGNVLIVHASKHKKNKWGVPKGKKEKGETIKKAAIRECKEETGICLKKHKKKVKKYRKKKFKDKIVVLYLYKTKKKPKAKPNGKEIDKITWIRQEKINIRHNNPKHFLLLKP